MQYTEWNMARGEAPYIHAAGCSDRFTDVGDVIDRIEHLEDVRDSGEDAELAFLVARLDALKGRGEEMQWRGDWYPSALIAEGCAQAS